MFAERSGGHRILCVGGGQEAEQLRHDPLVGVLWGEVAGVLELRHARVRQGLAP